MVEKYNKINYEIFCDLDGVLVDFDKGYEQLTGKDIRGTYSSSKEFWTPINKKGESFWSELEWTSEGKHIWNKISKYNPYILTAAGYHPTSFTGKKKWIKTHLSDTNYIICVSKKRKKYFSGKNRILIDDHPENIEQWNENGGIGIYHFDIRNTLNHLEYLGL
jgi:5'(3')-deoxyribonucleotidase